MTASVHKFLMLVPNKSVRIALHKKGAGVIFLLMKFVTFNSATLRKRLPTPFHMECILQQHLGKAALLLITPLDEDERREHEIIYGSQSRRVESLSPRNDFSYTPRIC